MIELMRYKIILGCCILAIGYIVQGCKQKLPKPTEQGKENWIKLFNGNNLDGWVVKIKGYDLGDNYKNTFRVVDEVIQVNYDGYNDTFNDAFGHMFYKKEFSNYRLRLQYRFTGEQLKDGAGWATRNSGVMLHSQNPESSFCAKYCFYMQHAFSICRSAHYEGYVTLLFARYIVA